MTASDLCDLVDRSKATVDHWLVDPDKPSYQTTPREIKDLLSTYDIIWTMMAEYKERMPRRAMQVFERVMARREDDES